MKTRASAPSCAPVAKSDQEWRGQLSDEQYRVTRQHGTERPFSHPLNDEKREGMFRCVCCGEPLFASDAKFNSGTGWPSFYKTAGEEHVASQEDVSHGMQRTEVHCAKCEAHLGHLFPDGPQPTGMRYCINGAALAFEPETPAGEVPKDKKAGGT